MKSNTKNLLTRDQIEGLVKVNFGDSYSIARIEELKGGAFNSAYLIERQGNKEKMVLKVSVAPGTKTLTYERDIMPTEVEVYQLIREHTTIPTPKVIAYDFSKMQVPSNYFFMTALEGQPMHKMLKQLTKENLDEIKKELAGYFAQLHQIKGEYFGYFTGDKNQQFKTWKDAFLHMMGMMLQDGREHGIKLPYDRYEKVLREKSSYLEEVKVPSLIDYDLWAGNVFLKKDADHYVIEGIVDFERAFWGDPLADFPPSVMILKELKEEPVFWKEYSKKSGYCYELGKAEVVRLAFYSLYIYTIMTVETFRYGFIYSRLQKAYAKNLVIKYLKVLEQA